jgi:hypothetical protein
LIRRSCCVSFRRATLPIGVQKKEWQGTRFSSGWCMVQDLLRSKSLHVLTLMANRRAHLSDLERAQSSLVFLHGQTGNLHFYMSAAYGLSTTGCFARESYHTRYSTHRRLMEFGWARKNYFSASMRCSSEETARLLCHACITYLFPFVHWAWPTEPGVQCRNEAQAGGWLEVGLGWD